MPTPDEIKKVAIDTLTGIFRSPTKTLLEGVAGKAGEKFKNQITNNELGDCAAWLRSSISDVPLAAFLEYKSLARTEGATLKSVVAADPTVLSPGINQIEAKITFSNWLRQAEVVHTDLIWVRDDFGMEGLMFDYDSNYKPVTPATTALPNGERAKVKTVRKFMGTFTIASRLKHIPSAKKVDPVDFVFVHAPKLHGSEGGTQECGKPEFFLDQGQQKLRPLPSWTEPEPSVNYYPSDEFGSKDWVGGHEDLYGVSSYNGLKSMSGVIAQLQCIQDLVCVHFVKVYQTRIQRDSDKAPDGWEVWSGTEPLDEWRPDRVRDALDVEQCDANRWSGDTPNILSQLEAWGWSRKEGQPDYAYAQFLSDELGKYEHIVYDAAKDAALNKGQPPSVCMANGVAECRRFSIIMVCALRASNIPARIVYNCMHNGTQGQPQWAPEAMHYIVEVFIEGAGWLILEPQGGILGNHSLPSSRFPGFILCAAHGVPTDEQVEDSDYLRATFSMTGDAKPGSLYPKIFKPQQSTMALTYLPASKWLRKINDGPPCLYSLRNYGALPGLVGRHVDPPGDDEKHDPAKDQPDTSLHGMWCVPNRKGREQAFRIMNIPDSDNPMILENLSKDAALVADLTWHIRERDAKGKVLYTEGSDIDRLPECYNTGGPPQDGLLSWAIETGLAEPYKHDFLLKWACSDFMESQEGKSALEIWKNARESESSEWALAQAMRPHLVETGLSQEILFDIWQLVDPKGYGKIGKEACVLAFYLAAQAKKDAAKFGAVTSAWLPNTNPRGTLDPAWLPKATMSGMPKNLWPPSDECWGGPHADTSDQYVEGDLMYRSSYPDPFA